MWSDDEVAAWKEAVKAMAQAAALPGEQPSIPRFLKGKWKATKSAAVVGPIDGDEEMAAMTAMVEDIEEEEAYTDSIWKERYEREHARVLELDDEWRKEWHANIKLQTKLRLCRERNRHLKEQLKLTEGFAIRNPEAFMNYNNRMKSLSDDK